MNVSWKVKCIILQIKRIEKECKLESEMNNITD